MVDFAIFTVYYIQTFPKINYYDDSWNNNNNNLTTEIYITMYIHIIQVDIMTGKNLHQFWLLTWNSFIGQFIHKSKALKW